MPTWITTPTPQFESLEWATELIVIDCRGWPMLSFWADTASRYRLGNWPVGPMGPFVDVRSTTAFVDMPVQGGIKTSLPDWHSGMPVVLPLRPIWPGFAVNSIFYAATLWLVFYVMLTLRRFIRRRRGLCPKCAYPVGESAVCTECGKELAT